MAVKDVFKKGTHVIADMILLEGPGISPYIMRKYIKAATDKVGEDSDTNLFTNFYLPKYPFKIPYIAECWLEHYTSSTSYTRYRESILEPSELSQEFLFKPIPVDNFINPKTYCLYNYGADRLGIFNSIITKEEYEETANWPIFVGSNPWDTLIIESEEEYKNISVELYSPTRVINLLDPMWQSSNGFDTVEKILQSPIEHTNVYIKAGDNELYFDDIITTYAEVYRKYIMRLISESNFSEGKTFSAKKISKKFWKDIKRIISERGGDDKK